jgi:hypothetical protein
MIRGVTWCGHRNNVPGLRQSSAASEWTKRLRCQFKPCWIEPGGPTIRKVSAYTPCPSACRAKFAGGNKDFAILEVRQTAIMIHVQMRENDLFHIMRSDAEGTQLRADLFLTIDPK